MADNAGEVGGIEHCGRQRIALAVSGEDEQRLAEGSGPASDRRSGRPGHRRRWSTTRASNESNRRSAIGRLDQRQAVLLKFEGRLKNKEISPSVIS